ncbi:hypothetical protein BKA64DRAFT_704445 [Cadophora sp. MPI-SDFR-AT-0126]|nr:hypothetical protein BKA64DRAFT_704445 [Leotiomycetes sp. MPI-SDFR-AT-0126]
MPPQLSHPLAPRYVPPSMYVHGAKLSAKLIALIVILTVFTALFSTCLCYICIKRRRARSRRLRREKEERENKQLRPRINGRNAKFFAPGLYAMKEGKKDESWLSDLAGRVRRGEDGRKSRGGWKEGLKGKVDRGVLERWNRREREYEIERDGFDVNVKDGVEVQEIEMQKLGVGVAGVYYETGGENGKMAVKKPEKAWLRWGRR